MAEPSHVADFGDNQTTAHQTATSYDLDLDSVAGGFEGAGIELELDDDLAPATVRALRPTPGIEFTEASIRAGPVGRPGGGSVTGEISLPQVLGTARFELGAQGGFRGTASWQVVVGASVPACAIRWRSTGWEPGTPVPLPVVVMGDETVDVRLPDPAGGTYEFTELGGRLPSEIGSTFDRAIGLTVDLGQPEPGPDAEPIGPEEAPIDELVAELVDGSGIGSAIESLIGATTSTIDDLVRRFDEHSGGGGEVPVGTHPPTPDVPAQGIQAPEAVSPPARPDQDRGSEPISSAGKGHDEPLAVEDQRPDRSRPPPPGGRAVGETEERHELLIPPAPRSPSAATIGRIAEVSNRAATAGRAAADLPTASRTAAEARAEVTEPAAEVQARAEAALVEELGARPAPSPEIVELATNIRESIRLRRPLDEDDLLETDPEEVATWAGDRLNASVQQEADRIAGSYRPLDEKPGESTPRGGVPARSPSPTADLGDLGAQRATPDPIPARDLSLAGDEQQVAGDVASSGIRTPTTAEIPSHPFSTVREGEEELAALSTERTAEVVGRQQMAIETARIDMAELQVKAAEALQGYRSDVVGSIGQGRRAMVGSEEMTRTRLSERASSLFSEAQKRVGELLAPLAEHTTTRWEAGAAQLATVFRQDLDRVRTWIDERHAGTGGAILALSDAVFGLPGWVGDEYDRAETAFAEGVHDLLLEISTEVNGVIAAAEAIIAAARERISALFANLPPHLEEWARGESIRFNDQLDGLVADVRGAQSDLITGVSERAVSAVSEVRQQVEALREEAGGVIGRLSAAIAEFIADPARFIIDGLLELVGIPPGSFWSLIARIQDVVSAIANDPLGFLELLLLGLGRGFRQFFDHFPDHLLSGFFDWLFRGLGDVGVEVPPDLSLPSLATLVLQVMGITWARFRKVLEDHLGPQAFELLETIWSMVEAFMRDGIRGIYDLFVPQFDPQGLVDTVVDAAISYVTEVLVVQAGKWIVSLLSPAGWVAKAVETIYTIVKWVIENAAPMFRFVETVVNGIARLLTGDVGGMATAIEMGLAATIPITVDFLAGLIGLGDLPEKVVELIGRLQKRVYDIMDRVIGWLVARARAMLARLGLTREAPPESGPGGGEDTELGDEVRFAGGGESHRIWIDSTARGATLMLASRPTSLLNRLNELRTTVGTRFKDDDGRRARGHQLIDQAMELTMSTDIAADELAAAFAAAATKKDIPAPDDSSVEQAEHALARLLRQVFELLGMDGEDLDLELLKVEIAAAMPGHVRRLGSRAHARWRRSIERVNFGAKKDERAQPLWGEGYRDNPLGTAEFEDAVHEARNVGLYDDYLLAYFKDEGGGHTGRTAKAQAFGSHAFVSSEKNKGAIRPAVIKALISAATRTLRKDYQRALETDKTKDEAFRKTAAEKLGAFDESPDLVGPYGRLPLPLVRLPDHSWFAPKETPKPNPDVKEEATKRSTTYETKAGAEFTVETEDLGKGIKHTVEGKRLSFHTRGRGVLQDVRGQLRRQGLDRAHVIANEVGGSGYAEALNIVTTSAYYNRHRMRASERQIRKLVKEEVDKKPLRDARFKLKVEVDMVGIDPTSTTELVLNDPRLKEHLVNHQKKIAVLTRAEVADAPMRRVTSVKYALTMKRKRLAPIDDPGLDRWIVFDV